MSLTSARDKYNQLIGSLHSGEISINPDTFLYHQWISHRPYTAKNKTFRAIKKAIKTTQKREYLDDLVSDANIYKALVNPELRSWSKEERAVPSALEAFDVFSMVLPLPFVLSLLRKYEEGEIKIAQVRRALHAVESFHFMSTAVVGRSSTGGLAKMYASYAAKVARAADSNEVGVYIKDLIAGLRERRPSFDEFEASFSELRFSSEFTTQKRLVRYVLSKLLLSTPAGKHLGQTSHLTIEHIHPERSGRRTTIPFESIESIGNLLLIDEDLNGELANKPFTQKKEIYKAAPGIHLDSVLLSAKRWQISQIDRRTGYLASEAYDKVWKF